MTWVLVIMWIGGGIGWQPFASSEECLDAARKVELETVESARINAKNLMSTRPVVAFCAAGAMKQ